MDAVGVAPNELSNLVNKIDNMLKMDNKATVKTDSTFDRDFGTNFNQPQNLKPTYSPSRLNSQFQPPAQVKRPVNLDNQINMNESYINRNECYNQGGKKSLEAILRDISKINSDLDTINFGPQTNSNM